MADPKRTGGAQPFFNDAVAGTKTEVTTAPNAKLFSLDLVNTVAAVTYLQIFFLPAASVTVGTTVPDYVVRLAASETRSISYPYGIGKVGTSGITLAGCTTATGNTGAAVSVGASYM